PLAIGRRRSLPITRKSDRGTDPLDRRGMRRREPSQGARWIRVRNIRQRKLPLHRNELRRLAGELESKGIGALLDPPGKLVRDHHAAQSEQRKREGERWQ